MPRRVNWRSGPALARWLYLATWLAVLALIWVAYAVARSTLEHNLERELRQRLRADTLMLEDHASRALDNVKSRLQSVAALAERADIEAGRLSAQTLRDMVFEDTLVRSLSLVDPQGLIVTSSTPSSVGQQVSPAVADMLGTSAPGQPAGVRFGRTLAQRDLPEPSGQEASAGASIWLAQIDLQDADLAGYRWLVAINPGFFQNLWAAVAQQVPLQLGLFAYDGTPVVTHGSGPGEASAFGKALAQSLQVRDNGEFTLDTPQDHDWYIHYRASSRHPLALVMLADRDAYLRLQLEQASVLWWSAWGGSLLVSAVVALFFAGRLRYERSMRLNRKLQLDAQTDPLTELANRRGFEALAPQELERASAFGQPLSLLIMDMDHFKSINDRFGHAAGDAVLRIVAGRWRALLRSHDLIARIGGEEFCVLLPATGLRNAQTVAMKLIEMTRGEPVPLPASADSLPVTVSIGLVGIDRCPREIDLDLLMSAADAALYRAKQKGRDRVEAVAWAQP